MVTSFTDTMDIITLNLPHGSGRVDFAAMVKICLGVSLFFTYPMMMFPVTHLLDKTFSLTTAPYRGVSRFFFLSIMYLYNFAGLFFIFRPLMGLLLNHVEFLYCSFVIIFAMRAPYMYLYWRKFKICKFWRQSKDLQYL